MRQLNRTYIANIVGFSCLFFFENYNYVFMFAKINNINIFNISIYVYLYKL